MRRRRWRLRNLFGSWTQHAKHGSRRAANGSFRWSDRRKEEEEEKTPKESEPVLFNARGLEPKIINTCIYNLFPLSDGQKEEEGRMLEFSVASRPQRPYPWAVRDGHRDFDTAGKTHRWCETLAVTQLVKHTGGVKH